MAPESVVKGLCWCNIEDSFLLNIPLELQHPPGKIRRPSLQIVSSKVDSRMVDLSTASSASALYRPPKLLSNFQNTILSLLSQNRGGCCRIGRDRMDGGKGPLRQFFKSAALLLALCILQRTEADGSVPTDWRTGIATFYGGAPDKMVIVWKLFPQPL